MVGKKKKVLKMKKLSKNHKSKSFGGMDTTITSFSEGINSKFTTTYFWGSNDTQYSSWGMKGGVWSSGSYSW